jgi:hypothetical protein
MSGIIGKNASRSSGVIGTAAAGMASLAADSSPQLGGFLDAAGNYIQMEKGGDIASASPTVIDTDGDFFAVTGTTNFSAFTVAADRHFFLEFGGALTMTHGAGTLDLPGAANITTAASDVGEFVSTAANVVTCVNYTKRDGTAVVAAASGVTKGTIGGLTCSNDSDAAHDILISVGSARDYADAVTMSLTTQITKRIDATWAVGDDNGGLDTGSVGANAGYGVWLIRRSDTGVVDAIFSLDMGAAGASITKPTNYDQIRLIGWVRTDGSSNILAFKQAGDFFRITGEIPTDLSDSSITDVTLETGTLTVPPFSQAWSYIFYNNPTMTDGHIRITFRTKGALDTLDSANNDNIFMQQDVAQKDRFIIWSQVFVDSASQIEYGATEPQGAADLSMRLYACTMYTRSNP